MKFPYGICDFYKIITSSYFYADRTDRIPMIENSGDHLLFLRPRRFGKSLLLSMLGNYYDVAKADEFGRLFGHLAIGKNPTPLHNRYFVMKWDFSAVDPQGDSSEIKRSLHNHINGCIEQFLACYEDRLPSVRIDDRDCLRSFQSVLAAVIRTPYRLYLLIDEYDNFANEVMMGSREISPDRYKALVYGEGCIKTLFKMIKSAAAGQGLERAFITGVSPVVMSDITSGYNIAENIYFKPEFDDLCGFGESEIRDTLERIVSNCDFTTAKAEEAMTMMKTFYNGFCFSGTRNIYNPTLSLYFMKHFHDYCEYPEEMLDENLAMDRGKIRYISKLPGGEQVIAEALNDTKPLSIARLARRFGAEDMLTEVKDRTFMASLLYFFGVLTMDGHTRFGELILKIPNLVIRKLYFERIREMLLPAARSDEAAQAAKALYTACEMEPLCDFIEQHCFKVFDNRDYRWANELTVKTAFLTLLFDDLFYITNSETALDRGYADMTMIVRPDMRKYQLLDILIEFKYVSLQDAGLSGTEVRVLSRDDLKASEPVRQKLAEAESRLEEYCRTLRKTYGDILRLRAFSVVSVGFERLVWQTHPPIPSLQES